MSQRKGLIGLLSRMFGQHIEPDPTPGKPDPPQVKGEAGKEDAGLPEKVAPETIDRIASAPPAGLQASLLAQLLRKKKHH
jgi:hypothetical protein